MKIDKSRQRAFTLFELLIVICIMSVLFSLLATALKSAREKARSIQCMNNLRQISLALATCANENDGWLPLNCSTNPGGGLWHQVLVRRGYLNGPYPDWKTFPKATLRCPSENRYSESGGEWIGPDGVNWYNGTDYCLNYWITQDGFFDSRPCKLFDIPAPAKYFLVADKYVFWGMSVPTQMAFRHSGGANMLFGDGHVEWLEKRAVGYCPTYSAASGLTPVDDRWKWW
ncbi:MAG: DUF1559 domain-containing protein [Verrucomicrobiae bacterium]|nr:DUF1559 domain-containing protein [Verrucomicrobiae bacterium]